MFYNCCLPITSNGIIAFRKNPETNLTEYLMIRRKHTLGLIDFIRGKYSVYNQYYVSNMIYQMTNAEKEMLKTMDFEEIWLLVWGKEANFSHYKNEETISKEKFYQLRSGINGQYTLADLVDTSPTKWDEPEWGFPKGRRNYQEKDIDCALREFSEETGYNQSRLTIIQNIIPYEEIFMGSNMKTYKHKYYVAYMQCPNNKLPSESSPIFQKTEVSKMGWFTYDDCIGRMRPYNLEKINILRKLNNALNEYKRVCN